ncbi:MAG: hypothetical protein OEV76_11640, partial [Anaerolineae bacterium]|nr:hypothetical protein [Anaerolineae bacterium]
YLMSFVLRYAAFSFDTAPRAILRLAQDRLRMKAAAQDAARRSWVGGPPPPQPSPLIGGGSP